MPPSIASLTPLDLLTAALAAFTLLLVAATVYMGREMSKARLLSVQPELALHITMISKMVAAPALTNIGAGAALEVDVRIDFVPAAVGASALDSRRWRTRLIVPGERHVFMPPLTDPGRAPSFEAFARSYDAIRVEGTFRDRLGRHHEINEEIADLGSVQGMGAGAKHLFEGDALGDAVAELRGPLDRIALAADGLMQRPAPAGNPYRVRVRRAIRQLLGLPHVTAGGFVSDVWWGPEGQRREQHRQRVARFRIGRALQRWLG